MAKDLMIQCGDGNCSRFRLSWVMEVLGGMAKITQDLTDTSSLEGRAAVLRVIDRSIPVRLFQQRYSPKVGHSVRGFHNRSSEPSLRALFKLFSDYDEAVCEDKRDNILGLRSLTFTCCKEAVPVDYSLRWPILLDNLVRHQIAHHYSIPKSATSESMVGMFQKFYRDWKTVSQNPPDKDSTTDETLEKFSKTFIHAGRVNDEYHSEEYGSDSIILKGYLRGRVLYKSRPLSTSCGSAKYTATDAKELTTLIKLQINFIYNLEKAGQAQHPYVTKEVDVLGNFIGRLLLRLTKGAASKT
jgi:hypothetical protein